MDSRIHDINSLRYIGLALHEMKGIHCLGTQRNCPVKIEFVKLKSTEISIASNLPAKARIGDIEKKSQNQLRKQHYT